MRRGAKGIRARQNAERYRKQKPVRGAVDVLLNEIDAEREEALAAEMLKPPSGLVSGCGELIQNDPADGSVNGWLVNTLAHPTMVGVNASQDRMEVAAECGVLESAVDLAESVSAGNSMERMLAHQAAAAHRAAMKLVACSLGAGVPAEEMARLSGAAARMMEAFQGAFLTLHKVRTGNRQTMVVQHVEISGGQAVVAGTVKSRGRGGRG